MRSEDCGGDINVQSNISVLICDSIRNDAEGAANIR